MTTKNEGLPQKAVGLLGSPRFWGITFGAAAYVVANPEKLMETVAGWFAAITAVRTIDRTADKVAEKGGE